MAAYRGFEIDHNLTQQQVADILMCKREVYRRYEKVIRDIPLIYAINYLNTMRGGPELSGRSQRIGLGEYIRNRRLHNAALDLKETEDKVTVIDPESVRDKLYEIACCGTAN